ncbi:voltage-gated potassium channel [Thiothrix caldifontis]|jgi:Kef-type K+ transport systems, predicted NAD-binding component|uniref:Voltage-gated potassium channel n=1 Tax=Thiothrix caldifontis TaxID=525918 RepID=A0A1H3YG41_9GAMM|nr:ion transporter [Thiothrix caldifontis]SEA09974.1 voltage-gated potassium channel [Thiothrix caldifontis]
MRLVHIRRWLYLALEEQKGSDLAKCLNRCLLLLIVINVCVVVAESEYRIYQAYALSFQWFEIFSVGVFTLEYLVRAWVCVESNHRNLQYPIRSRGRYLLSPMAVVDLIAILPFYLSFFVVGLDLRVLRSLRLLRLLKLTRYSQSLGLLVAVLRQEADNLVSALFILCMLILLSATGIYLAEGHIQPDEFGSIPRALWWSAVTVATVGYGDVVPQTLVGKVFSGTIIVTGIAVAALPAAILASGMINELKRRRENFRFELVRAMENGKLDFGGLRYLEKMRVKIGISRADARLVFEEVKQETRLQTYTHCPYCSQPIMVKHPPGHIHVSPTKQSPKS